MPSHVLQRENWNGHPVDCGDAWVLRKGDKVARCVLKSHLFGYELILLVDGDLLRSQVCRTTDETLETHEQWKAAMTEKGWKE